jgi:glycerate kinase
MKIVIAMDSFKGSLKARQACEITAKAIEKIAPESEIVLKPMADGGEGTAKVLMASAKGRWIKKTVTGPLPDMKVNTGFVWFEKEKIACIEMASASGLELLKKSQLNPLKTTTFGTGELIMASLKYKPKKILLAVGGSATIDGGVGAAIALGWKFLDALGSSVGLGGQSLRKIKRIVKPKHLKLPPVEVLCDVKNKLCGKNGAARIFGPQKGATKEMVNELDSGLKYLAQIIRKQLKRNVINLPSAGAAGGLAAGAAAFMNAKLVSGIDVVMSMSNLYEELKKSDWVITGEGSFDSQSLKGKVVSGIIKASRKTKTRVAVLAGRVKLSHKEYRKAGVTAAIDCSGENLPLDYAIRNARRLLFDAAEKFAIQYLNNLTI